MCAIYSDAVAILVPLVIGLIVAYVSQFFLSEIGDRLLLTILAEAPRTSLFRRP